MLSTLFFRQRQLTNYLQNHLTIQQKLMLTNVKVSIWPNLKRGGGGELNPF